MTETLPSNYVIPPIGAQDSVGRAIRDLCWFKFNTRDGEWVCTLPRGHWGDFHVAHIGQRVVGVHNRPPEEPWLQVQEGL